MKPLNVTEDHACHCVHVAIVQTKISLVEKLVTMALVGTFAVAGTLLATFINRRLSWEAPPPSASERMFLDRVNKPDKPPEER